MTATEKAFDINIESLFTDIPNAKELIEKLQNFPLTSSSCLSCQVGIVQHMDRRDLLKVESLSNLSTPLFLIFILIDLVYNQIRGFKTRHANATGISGSGSTAHGGSTRLGNIFDTYQSGAASSNRPTQFPNDPNQPPLAAFVNRVRRIVFFCVL